MDRVPMTCVSFGDVGKPLGVVFIEGTHTADEAARLTAFMHLNPGGLVLVQHMPVDVVDEEYKAVRRNRNRLLSVEQVETFMSGKTNRVEMTQSGLRVVGESPAAGE
jgi:hypothetical protein